MLDPLIQIVLNHNPQAISKEAYQSWKDNPVTRQLLFDTAEAVLDSLIDPLPDIPITEIGGIAIAREQARETALSIVDWSPLGEDGRQYEEDDIRINQEGFGL